MSPSVTMTAPTPMMGTMTTDQGRASRLAAFSVRTRITVAVALLVGLALFGAGLVVYALESAHIEQAVAAQVEQELGEFAALEAGIDPETAQPFTDVRRLIRLFLQRNVPDDDELLLGYWDGKPQVASGSRHAETFSRHQPFLDMVRELVATGGTARLPTAQWGEVVVTVQPVRDRTTSGGFVIANFLEDEDRQLERVIHTYSIVSVLSLGFITAVAAWLAGRLLRPLRTLRETAQDITETDLSRRIPQTGNDDITALTRTFNEMLARLDSAFTGQREFLDDAGHELKTPLTVLRGHMELLDSDDRTELETTRELLLDEIDRMSRLVNDLIMLAKADRPDFVKPASVNIGPFTETVLEKCRAIGDRTWTLDEQAEYLAEIDEQRITQALLQLAQNAVKHTETGDVIAIGSRVHADDGLELWVRDTGHGVRDEHKDVIFERFGRGPAANDDGFGLGLSIVRAIAASHGGTVTVRDAVPHGAVFVLTLPVRRKEDAWLAS
jgi:two-component system OmpR family sensor kinase